MTKTALVIGGTGPTGPFIVAGLRERGYQTAILHTGNHEVPEIPADVEHIHTDPFSRDALAAALDGRSFDVVVATYGRLRVVAELLVSRCGQLVSIGGAPAYRGYMDAQVFDPPGMPVPVAEGAQLIETLEESHKGRRIVESEEVVFDLHPNAAHFRYPYVYGPRQLLPREWCIVRRILDGRPFIVIPDAGLTLCTFGYAANLAHAVLLAVDQPEVAAGQIYNCGDRQTLSLHQVVEVIATEFEWQGEIVSLPYDLALPARPMIMQPGTTHRVFDLSKLERELGYEDIVPPRQALAATARWLVANPPEPGGMEETVLQDPFDYAAEDRLVEAWRKARASIPDPSYEREPGYGLSYAGPRTTRTGE